MPRLLNQPIFNALIPVGILLVELWQEYPYENFYHPVTATGCHMYYRMPTVVLPKVLPVETGGVRYNASHFQRHPWSLTCSDSTISVTIPVLVLLCKRHHQNCFLPECLSSSCSPDRYTSEPTCDHEF